MTLLSQPRDLGPQHGAVFRTAVTSVLNTSISEKTYAQIIDGMPLANVWHGYPNQRHSLIERHHDLCPGVWECMKRFQASIDPMDLQLNTEAYQNTEFGSRAFGLRLLELVARACHHIGVLLFQNFNDGPHKGCEAWTNPVSPDILVKPLQTVFYHNAYLEAGNYPHGIADIVGYWAEAQIFGGVVVFDRGDDDTGCHDAFLHPFGARRLLFQLSESQLDLCCRFLQTPTSENVPVLSPFPLQADKSARRIDPWDALSELHIFRDRYERTLPEFRVHNCVLTPEDDPNISNLMAIVRERFL